MKKISLIVGTLILSGCTMGINQSVATINNRPYLVEKKTYTLPIPIYQWSGDIEITPLQITNENNIAFKQIYEKASKYCWFSTKDKTSYDECLTKYFNENTK